MAAAATTTVPDPGFAPTDPSISGLADLTKSNSTASAGRFSFTSHASIPVTGTFPFGSLKVHEPMETPTSQETAIVEEEMPALEEPAEQEDDPDFLQHGDVFLVLDLPEKFTVGCDAAAITTSTSRFLGMRDLPPGPHFIWVSEPNAMSRCGYWFVSKDPGELRLKQWDRYNEVLGEVASQFEAREQREGIRSTYPKLIPYGVRDDSTNPPTPPPKDLPRPGSKTEPDFASNDTLLWHRITSSITEGMLSRVTGRRGVSEWLVDTSDGAKGELNFPQASKLLKAVVGSELNFLFSQDAVDAHRLVERNTSMATPSPSPSSVIGGLDTTAQMLAVLKSPSSDLTPTDVAGELQFAFLTGLHLSNLSCLEHWWHLVLRVILRAHGLAIARPRLCRDLIQTLHAQLVYNEQRIEGSSTGGNSVKPGEAEEGSGTGILEAMPRNKTRLREALTVYKRRLNETLLGLGDRITAEQGDVGKAFLDLEAWFWRYGWDLRSDYSPAAGNGADDDDEYQPVVVDLDENGREVGLMSWN